MDNFTVHVHGRLAIVLQTLWTKVNKTNNWSKTGVEIYEAICHSWYVYSENSTRIL